jgi:alpha-beta hydrolase superfamily lysophospholipase
LTPEQLRELRDTLPAFAGAGSATALQLEFCRFYGIDFQERLAGVQYRVGAVSSGAHTLAVHRWLQTGASSNLLLVHGYFDHSGLYGKLIAYGLSRNCNVLIFDLPGHGLSSGEPAVIDDFGDYAAAIAAVIEAAITPGLPMWVMAQSTGCAALVEYTRHNSWPFSAAVMLAPLLRPAGWSAGRLAHGLIRHFTDSVERKFSRNSSDAEFLQFLRRDPLQSQRLPLRWVSALKRWLASLPSGSLGPGPVLIVQGDDDHTVDWRYNVEYYRRMFPGSRVELLQGAGHQLANEASSVRKQYLNLIDNYLASRELVLGEALINK